ncbi:MULTISPECIES: hypothetical protein [Alistipes]|jgi:hypothetical protein|uniref:hypothetical protein n=1 Tax=Alistipes TaxID=239759 RepID=UPI000B853476|nr:MULTISPECIES: hypothetical protein [Alistipes]
MKSFHLFIVFATSFLTVSCGASKKTTSSDYQYQQWKQQQEQQATAPQRPARTLRTTEPCIELAQADAENLRAYGTATSYVEKTALNEAERDARNRLAAMIKVAVEGAAQDYEQNANKNLKKSAGTIGESVMTQFVAEEIKNTRILKTSIYDLADGSIQVYVCLEIRTNKNDFEKNLNNTLDRDGIIELQYDRDRFVKKMAEGLEEYKKKQIQE